jgi:hypothetical protein
MRTLVGTLSDRPAGAAAFHPALSLPESALKRPLQAVGRQEPILAWARKAGIQRPVAPL